MPNSTSPRRSYPQLAVDDFLVEQPPWAMAPGIAPAVASNQRGPLPIIGVTRATRLWSSPMGLFSPPSTPYAPPMMPAPPPPPPTPVDNSVEDAAARTKAQ